jgi:hypothetical protein
VANWPKDLEKNQASPWARLARVRVDDPASPLHGRVGLVSHITPEGGVFVQFRDAFVQFRSEQLTASDSGRA